MILTKCIYIVDRLWDREIDRVFKKVKEGLEEFDFIYVKLQDCDNQSQKEKLEGDLKKEIKKLQRSRELIKNWMSGSEVKDKKPLIEHRKLIEHEMERFKEVEKMMKTKAFSNEALASTTEVVDPRKKEKMECADFIQNNIEELQRQMEATEAEIDQVFSSMKKKKHDTSKQTQIDNLQEKLSRHKWHISMLESILRHLENDNIEVEQINDIKEDIEYYVDSNDDPNFIEDDTFYDTLGLDEMEDSFAVIPDENDVQSMPDENEIKDKVKEKEKEKEKDKPVEKPIEKPVEKEKKKVEKDKIEKIVLDDKKSSTSTTASSNNSPSLKNVSLGSTLAASANVSTPSGTPKLNYASVAMSGIKKPLTPAAVSYASLASSLNNANNIYNHSTPPQQTDNDTAMTPHTTPSSLSIQMNKLSLDETSQMYQKRDQQQQQQRNIEQIQQSSESSIINTPTTTSSTTLDYIEKLADANASRILKNSISSNEYIPNIQNALHFLNSENFDNLPQGFDQYVEAIETAKNRLFKFKKQEELHVPSKKSQPPAMICETKLPSYDEIKIYLENSLMNCPDSYDADKPHNYMPVNPHFTQANFPDDPLPELIGSTKTLEMVNVDTLFYAFYYSNLRMPSQYSNYHNLEPNPDDDYLQFAAANELHRRGWNYQAHTHTWFQKDEEMGEGNWKSFDYKDTWICRRNTNFKYDANDIEKRYFSWSEFV